VSDRIGTESAKRKYIQLGRGFSVGVKGVRRTFPRASRAPSKKSNTPSMINIPPNEVRATPISATGRWNQYSSSVYRQGGFGLTLGVGKPHLVLTCRGSGEEGEECRRTVGD
jgi:hypothetical protein